MNQPLSTDEKLHRELYQQAHAIIAVFNPTSEDYRLVFDRRIHIIPNENKDFGKGKGVEYLSAYLAKKYATEMTNKILQDRAMTLVNEENDRRREAGMALLTKYPGDNPQEVVEAQIRVNDPKVRSDVMKSLIKGMVQKAPDDLMLIENEERKDTTIPVDDQIFSAIQDTPYSPTYQAPDASLNTQAAKENLITNLENQHDQTQEQTI